MPKTYRILIGLTDPAGYNAGLKQGFCDTGIQAVALNLSGNPFRFPSDNALNPLTRLCAFLSRKRAGTTGVQRLMWGGLEVLSRLPLLIWAISRFNVFIFCCNSSILFLYDLPLLRLLGKRIIYVQHGSDVRPPYIDGALMFGKKRRSIDECIRLTRRNRQAVRTIEQYADYVIAYTTIVHFHQKPVVNFSMIGFPRRIPPLPPAPPRLSNAVRIAHAPSTPISKGTPQLREMIARLQAKGYDIEWVEIINKPNDEVLRALNQCDFVLDQLYHDNLMGGVALEAATLGKAAVVGSYAFDALRQPVPAEAVPPTCTVLPQDVEAAVERLIVDTEYRRDLGARARQFVLSHWSPAEVARRYLRLLDGEAPPEWFYDPHTMTYLYGVGMSSDQVQETVRAVIDRAGQAALCLSHKPDLEKAFVHLGGTLKSNI